MIIQKIKTSGHYTIAMTAGGQLAQQNGRTSGFKPLPKSPAKLVDFQICNAGIIATAEGATGKNAFILAKDPRSHRYEKGWIPLSIPFCPETASNGTVFAGLDADGKFHVAGFNIQEPAATKEVPELAKATGLAMNTFGLYATSGKKTYMAANAGRLGDFAPWQPVKTI